MPRVKANAAEERVTAPGALDSFAVGGEAKQKSPSSLDRRGRPPLKFEIVRVALETFRRLSDHLDVPYTFCVPEAAPWPEEAWGLRLGARVSLIRSRGSFVTGFPERRAALDARAGVP